MDRVFVFCGQQESLPVHLSSLQFGHFTSGVHKATETSRSAVKKARCQAARLLRWLTDPCRYSRTDPSACPDDHQFAPVSRLDYQLREVRPHSKSGLPVHRDAVQHSTVHSGCVSKSSLFTNTGWPTLSSQPAICTDCWAWWCSWQHWYHGEDSASVQSSGGPPQLGARGQGTGLTGVQFLSGYCQRWHGGRLQQFCKVYPLAARAMEVILFTDVSSSGWWAQLWSHSTQGLWSASQRSWHIQRSGDAGRHQHRESLPSSSEIPGGSLDVRQCCDCGVHQERGGHTILHSHAAEVTPAEVVRLQGDKTGSRPSARSPQRPGRFTVQSWPDTEHQVHDGHGSSPTSFCPVGRATSWLVCNICQQTTHQVCIAVSGYQGGVHGRHVGSLGQREGPPVRISTIQDGLSSPVKGRSVSRCSDDSDRSSAGNSFMVPGTSGPVPRRSHPAAHQRSATADSGRRSVRWGHRDSSLPAIKSSHVKTLWAILLSKGHSREAAEMMSKALRESSLHVYESHWARFVHFCGLKRWHVFRVRSHHYTTYMMHLFRDGLLPSTIISHRTSVASVLRHCVYDPAADPHIKLLIWAFRLERPVQRRIMPKWDLHLVILALMSLLFASEVGD